MGESSIVGDSALRGDGSPNTHSDLTYLLMIEITDVYGKLLRPISKIPLACNGW
jgi:hypothetical protein